MTKLSPNPSKSKTDEFTQPIFQGCIPVQLSGYCTDHHARVMTGQFRFLKTELTQLVLDLTNAQPRQMNTPNMVYNGHAITDIVLFWGNFNGQVY